MVRMHTNGPNPTDPKPSGLSGLLLRESGHLLGQRMTRAVHWLPEPPNALDLSATLQMLPTKILV